MHELEAKLRVVDNVQIDQVVSHLALRDTRVLPEIAQEDFVYAVDASVITSAVEGSIVARIRVEEDQVTLTVKQRRRTELDRTEYETSVGDGDAAHALLRLLGLNLQVVVRKIRQTIQVSDETTVLVDRVANLGTFIEVEVLYENPALANARLADILERFRNASFVIGEELRGYDSLLLDQGSVS